LWHPSGPIANSLLSAFLAAKLLASVNLPNGHMPKKNKSIKKGEKNKQTSAGYLRTVGNVEVQRQRLTQTKWLPIISVCTGRKSQGTSEYILIKYKNRVTND